jgi:TolB protein
VSTRTGTPEIYAMNADGSEQISVTDGPAIDEWPSWSPDGKRLAFQRFAEDDYKIFVVNPDGTGLVNISNSSGTLENVGPQAWGP